MEHVFIRIWEDLIGRLSGPMKFRLVLQPTMAAVFAILAGLKDAREGHPPYLWVIFSDPVHRRELLKEGWKAVAKVFAIALIMDLIYQIIVFRWFYPGEALIIAAILGFFPYILIRGPLNRIMRKR